MDPGKLDQRILIETPTVVQNGLGEDVEIGWSQHSRPWAKLMQTPGREFLAGGDYQAESRVVFQIRWRAVGSKARVTWRDRVFRVNDVTGTQHDGWAWLHCIAQDGENR